MVTHSGLTAGYQVAQTAHAVANFARFDSDAFACWHSRSQYLVALQAPCADALEGLLSRALAAGLTVHPFREPDIGDQLTAIAFSPDPRNKRFLSSLPLAGKQTGSTSKHASASSGASACHNACRSPTGHAGDTAPPNAAPIAPSIAVLSAPSKEN